MKIAIYSICKNEELFAKRFAESVKNVEKVFVFDTGSTDNTKDILKNYPNIILKEIRIEPFRFDTARNIALNNIPEDIDILISMDLDDILLPNAIDVIKNNWELGKTTMLNYPYIHAWEDISQTIPRITILGFKVHCPKSYCWEYPIHEILSPKPSIPINEKIIQEQILQHKPDWNKEERRSRIQIFERHLTEYKNNPRMLYLFGRELFFHNNYTEAIKILKEYLNLNNKYIENEYQEDSSPSTRASACRLIASSLIALKEDPNDIIVWFLRSVSESPGERETWMWLAWAWAMVGDGFSAYAAAQRGVQINDKLKSIEIEGRCWGEQAESLLESTKKMMLSQIN